MASVLEFYSSQTTSAYHFRMAVHRNDEITPNVKECSLFDNH